MLRFHGQNYWHQTMCSSIRVPAKQPQEVITWRWSLRCNGNHGKTLEESCRHGMEPAQKGCVCSSRGRPAVAGHSSTLEPRWFCHNPQPLDLDLRRLFQPFFLLCPYFSLLEWNCLLCVTVHRHTQCDFDSTGFLCRLPLVLEDLLDFWTVAWLLKDYGDF